MKLFSSDSGQTRSPLARIVAYSCELKLQGKDFEFRSLFELSHALINDKALEDRINASLDRALTKRSNTNLKDDILADVLVSCSTCACDLNFVPDSDGDLYLQGQALVNLVYPCFDADDFGLVTFVQDPSYPPAWHLFVIRQSMTSLLEEAMPIMKTPVETEADLAKWTMTEFMVD